MSVLKNLSFLFMSCKQWMLAGGPEFSGIGPANLHWLRLQGICLCRAGLLLKILSRSLFRESRLIRRISLDSGGEPG